MSSEPSAQRIKALYDRLKREAEASGYHLNPDVEFATALVESLLINEQRYGYPSCPCRLAAGVKAEDLDIICPCDYRDTDLDEYAACYCALYVSAAIVSGLKQAQAIPERRPLPDKRRRAEAQATAGRPVTLPYPVWRCKVCGYLSARDEPPEICPICKAKKERFERFM